MAVLTKIIQYDSYSFPALLAEALGDVCNNTGHFYSAFRSVVFLSFGDPHLFWTQSKIPSNGQASFFFPTDE